jgi:tRNA(Ile)-lysidine synthase TilS/MesJ
MALNLETRLIRSLQNANRDYELICFEIIRPLAFVEERLLQQYAWENTFPVIEDPCPERLKSKRRFIKELLAQLEKKNQG